MLVIRLLNLKSEINTPPVAGGVPEGRGGYSPLGKGQEQTLPIQLCSIQIFGFIIP
jgi:hypothetical protein